MYASSGNFEIRYLPIELNPVLPIVVDMDFVQRDAPIHYLHYHQCLELGYCYEGSGVFVVGEKVLSFAAGDVVLINSTEVHLARSAPGTTSRWCWIYLDPLRLVTLVEAQQAVLDPTALAGPGFENVVSPSEDAELGRLVRKMAEELSGQAEGYEWCLQSLVLEFMVHLRRLPRVRRLSGSAVARRDLERIAPALQMIARDYVKALSLGELARACHVSEPSLRRLFQQAVGRSPRDYWLDMRLRMAASMLRATPKTVLEISQEVGFPTLSSFNRLFRAKYGMTPSRWRSGA
jgi:AraC-like DNA-binding protein